MPTTDTIRILHVPVGAPPRVLAIDPNLGTLQRLVGGLIDCVTVADQIVIVANEEAAFQDLPANTAGFLGPFLFVRSNPEGDFISLTDRDLARAKAWLARHAADTRPRVGCWT